MDGARGMWHHWDVQHYAEVTACRRLLSEPRVLGWWTFCSGAGRARGLPGGGGGGPLETGARAMDGMEALWRSANGSPPLAVVRMQWAAQANPQGSSKEAHLFTPPEQPPPPFRASLTGSSNVCQQHRHQQKWRLLLLQITGAPSPPFVIASGCM